VIEIVVVTWRSEFKVISHYHEVGGIEIRFELRVPVEGNTRFTRHSCIGREKVVVIRLRGFASLFFNDIAGYISRRVEGNATYR